MEEMYLMKRIKNTLKAGIIFILSFILLCPCTAYAALDSEMVTKEYLDDGSYFEIVITSSNSRSTIKNASKTATYKNADGKALWYAKVTANFYYDGSSSRCTSATASAGTYSSNWKILDKKSSYSGNTGSATVRAGIYTAEVVVGSHTKTVSLSCDKNGNLS